MIEKVYQIINKPNSESPVTLGYYTKIITAQDRVESELELDVGLDSKLVMWYWNGDDYECWIITPNSDKSTFSAKRTEYVITQLDVIASGED